MNNKYILNSFKETKKKQKLKARRYLCTLVVREDIVHIYFSISNCLSISLSLSFFLKVESDTKERIYIYTY